MTTILKGRIDAIFQVEIKGFFEKRVFWLREVVNAPDTKKPDIWQLETSGATMDLLDNFKPNQLVECNVDVRGYKWKKDGKEVVFNSLTCTMIRCQFQK